MDNVFLIIGVIASFFSIVGGVVSMVSYFKIKKEKIRVLNNIWTLNYMEIREILKTILLNLRSLLSNIHQPIRGININNICTEIEGKIDICLNRLGLEGEDNNLRIMIEQVHDVRSIEKDKLDKTIKVVNDAIAYINTITFNRASM